jgi:hypothetical protein
MWQIYCGELSYSQNFNSYDKSTEIMDPKRRDFLKTASAATLSALATGTPHSRAETPRQQWAKPSADSVIILWMAGGMAAPDTFDPKHYIPFEVGVPVEKILSTFPAIDTAVDNIKITEGLENIAKVMDRGTLVRSHRVADLGHILHSRHQYHWHTGYEPPITVAAPHIGSWIAKTLGARNPAIPPFLDIGQVMSAGGETEALKAFHTAGFLGSEHGPFMIPKPDLAVKAVQPPPGMDSGRFANRYKAFQKLAEHSPVYHHGSGFQRESLLRSMENAHRILSDEKAAKAFDITLEPKDNFEKYNTGEFGRGCLLAKRLVEAGSRFIEVTTGYYPFKKWDTHENGHTTVRSMKQEIDRPIAQLILDLEEKGLLDRTLVVLASEFSRDMIIEGVPGSSARDQSRARTTVLREMKHYGQHRHFTGSGSVLLFGGGIKKGFLYGETAEERPLLSIKNPVTIPDLHATIYHALGIPPNHNYEIERRPFYLTKDGKGKPVKELFA